MEDEKFYIMTRAHKSIWPKGVILFWASDQAGYASTLELAGRYSREEAESICSTRIQGATPVNFMVPCAKVEAEARRIVDIDLFNQLAGEVVVERAEVHEEDLAVMACQ